jgi:hypothetical protein
MNDSIIQQCLDILKKENISKPILDFILSKFYPYFYVVMSVTCLNTVMILAILVMLLRKKSPFHKEE